MHIPGVVGGRATDLVFVKFMDRLVDDIAADEVNGRLGGKFLYVSKVELTGA